jgi:hypothetical protein
VLKLLSAGDFHGNLVDLVPNGDDGHVVLSYSEAEVAVECVSYIVASAAGLDTTSEAIPYMAGWGGIEARGKVRHLAGVIDQAAKELEALHHD